MGAYFYFREVSYNQITLSIAHLFFSKTEIRFPRFERRIFRITGFYDL